jgi:hypothetical protein
LPIAERAAPARIEVTDRASGTIDMAPRPPVPVPMPWPRPDRSAAKRAADKGGFLRKSRGFEQGRDSHRGGGGGNCGRQRECDGSDTDSLVHAGLSRLVPVVPAPMAGRRQVPFARPNIGWHEVGLRTSPNGRSQHRPRIVPNGPMVPLPIFPGPPFPRAPAKVMDLLHGAAIQGRGRHFGERCKGKSLRAICRRAKRKGEHGSGNSDLVHAFLPAGG